MPYVANDAFCTQTDVEAKAARGVYDANTVPTAQQVLDAMAMRAAEVEGVIQRGGLNYTVPSRDRPFPAYGAGTDQEDRLRVLCQQANAWGAAMDAVCMQDASARASSKELIEILAGMYQATIKALEEYIFLVVEGPAAAGAVNRTVPLTIQQAVSTPLPFGYGTEW